MASHVKHVTRTTITRRPLDIDPKIAAVALVALATVLIVAAIVAVQVATGGRVDLVAALGPIVPVLLALLAGYVKRSSHAELIEDGVHIADEAVHVLAPVVEQLHVVPPVLVQEVVDGVDLIEHALAPAAGRDAAATD